MVAENNRRKPKRAREPRKTNGDTERFLLSDEAMKAIPPDIRRAQLKALERQRRVLSRRTPSSTWRDDAWYHGAEFPPAWDHPRTHQLTEPPATAMKCCRACGRETPPNCVGSSGVCLDCFYCASPAALRCELPASGSTVDMARLKASHRRGKSYDGAI